MNQNMHLLHPCPTGHRKWLSGISAPDTQQGLPLHLLLGTTAPSLSAASTCPTGPCPDGVPRDQGGEGGLDTEGQAGCADHCQASPKVTRVQSGRGCRTKPTPACPGLQRGGCSLRASSVQARSDPPGRLALPPRAPAPGSGCAQPSRTRECPARLCVPSRHPGQGNQGHSVLSRPRSSAQRTRSPGTQLSALCPNPGARMAGTPSSSPGNWPPMQGRWLAPSRSLGNEGNKV